MNDERVIEMLQQRIQNLEKTLRELQKALAESIVNELEAAEKLEDIVNHYKTIFGGGKHPPANN